MIFQGGLAPFPHLGSSPLWIPHDWAYHCSRVQLLSCSILVAYITLRVHRLLYICFLTKAKCPKIFRYGSAIDCVVKGLSWFYLVVHMRFRIVSILLLFIHLLLLSLCVGVVLGNCFVVLFSVSVTVLQSRELLALLHCVLTVVWFSVFCVSSTQCIGLVCSIYMIVAFPGHTDRWHSTIKIIPDNVFCLFVFSYQRIVQTSLGLKESNCFSRGVRTRFSKAMGPPLDPLMTGRTIVLGCSSSLFHFCCLSYTNEDVVLVHRLV